MLSYKEYKQLNESLYGAFNLGIKQNNVLTPPIGATGASELIETTPEEDSIEEAKKNKEEKGLTDAQKKLPKALQDAILKKKNKNKDHDKEEKDHDKEEKDHDKEEKDHDKEEKGLTDAQKKLPKALQNAILKKKNMTEEEQTWWDSVNEMMANPNEKNWDGWSEVGEVEQAVRDEIDEGM